MFTTLTYDESACLCMQVATDYIAQVINAVKRDKSIRAIDAKQELQDGVQPVFSS